MKVTPQSRNIELRKYIKELEEENKFLRKVVEQHNNDGILKVRKYLQLIRK